MNTVTAERVIADALSQVGAVAAGQTASAEDVLLARSRLDSLLDDLSGRRVVYVPDPERISGAEALWIARILALHLVPDFGGGAELLVDQATCEAALRRLNPAISFSRPVRVAYF